MIICLKLTISGYTLTHPYMIVQPKNFCRYVWIVKHLRVSENLAHNEDPCVHTATLEEMNDEQRFGPFF
jgi:hypothetical protein